MPILNSNFDANLCISDQMEHGPYIQVKSSFFLGALRIYEISG